MKNYRKMMWMLLPLMGMMAAPSSAQRLAAPNPDDYDIGQGGMTIWEGDEVLNWGDGLQLSLPATLPVGGYELAASAQQSPSSTACSRRASNCPTPPTACGRHSG